jgi:hypothetical protein
MADQDGASVETLKEIAAAFNAHDLDAIMDFFVEDCSLDMPRGPEPWGLRLTGKAAVRCACADATTGSSAVTRSSARTRTGRSSTRPSRDDPTRCWISKIACESADARGRLPG